MSQSLHAHDHADDGGESHDHDHAHAEPHGDACGGHGPVPVTVRLAPGERDAAVARARLLNRVSLGWNVVEGVVAVLAGVAAGSVSLVGFGIDSGIEVAAALILFWRLRQERRSGCMLGYDRTAVRLIALAFAALAAYVWVEAARDLLGAHEPDVSTVGLALASLSLVVMPFLARAKRELAPVLGSQAAASEANQTRLCALLSAVVLAGLGLNAVAGWWWADPLAAVVIGGIAGTEAVRTWNAEALADTCCS
jgi:divalent metal cation (Fe/Co/Zn/Cd) transporter